MKKLLISKHNLLPSIVAVCCGILGWIFYTNLAAVNYSMLIDTYGTVFLSSITRMNITVFEFLNNILARNLIMVSFIIFISALSTLVLKAVKLLVDGQYVNQGIAKIAYSTFAVYLFHRPFLILFNIIMSELFSIDMLEKENFIFTLVSLPLLFISAYFIQKYADKGFPVVIECVFKRERSV